MAECITSCADFIAAKGPKSPYKGQMKQYKSGALFERVVIDVNRKWSEISPFGLPNIVKL